MTNPPRYPCISVQLLLVLSCLSQPLSAHSVWSLRLIYSRPTLWVWFSPGYISIGRCMAVLLTKFPPEALLTAVPETLPPVGAADGQYFLRERAVISSRGRGQGRAGMYRTGTPPGRLQRGAPAVLLLRSWRDQPQCWRSRRSWAGWCSPLPASHRAFEHLARVSGCPVPLLPGFTW